jgi:predicted DNA-binding transcriptional regulator YafY
MQFVIKDLYRENLELAALLAGFTHGNKGSPTAAISAVGEGTHQILPCPDGYTPEALKLMVQGIDLIKNAIPFTITYRSPAGKIQSFEARFATITHREKRHYLECWITEADEIATIKQLAHNRSFRFDRILCLSSISGNWQAAGLDTIEVKFRLYRKLADAYDPRQADILLTSIEDGIEVDRKISDAFWFTREVLPYGADCEVIAPDAIRSNIKAHFKAALLRYGAQ